MRALSFQQEKFDRDSWFCATEDGREFERTAGDANNHDQQFDCSLVSLLCLRSLNCAAGNFLLGSNLAGLGQFGDVFLKLSWGYRSQACLLQLKHKDEVGRITQEQLMNPEGIFSISKYYESYCVLEDSYKGLTQIPNSDIIRETNFQDCTFVLYTNSSVEHKSKNITMIQLSAAEKLLVTGDENREIFYFGPEDEGIWNLCTDCEDSNRFHAFLARFLIHSGKSDVQQLRLLLKEEVSDCAQMHGKDTEVLCSSFHRRMENWWTKENTFLSESCPQWNEVLLEVLNSSMLSKLQIVKYKFEQNYFEYLDGYLGGDAFLNVTVPGIRSNIRCLKMYTELERNYPGRYLLMDADIVVQRMKQVLSLCHRGFCTVLVVNQQDNFDLKYATRDLRPDLCRVVLLSKMDVDMGDTPCRRLEDRWSLDQLTRDSQERILESEVVFQGEAVRLKELFSRGLGRALGGKALGTLLEGGTVSIGRAPSTPEELYIPRTLRHMVTLREDVLRTVHRDDIFAVTCFPLDRQIANAFPASGSDQSTIILSYAGSNTSHQSASHAKHLDRKKYLGICSKYRSKKSIHWVLYEDGFLLWKESCGSDTTPSQYTMRLSSSCEGLESCSHEAGVQEEWTQRLLLVTGEPGMGKSTLLKHISYETKRRETASWVVYVALRNFTKALYNLSAESLTLQQVYDILADAASVGTSTCPDLARKLLLDGLEGAGKTSVLLDAVDEIRPTYFVQVLKLVQLLLGTKLAQLWVASRTALQEHLQRELSVLPLILEPFSIKDQHFFFSHYFSLKEPDINVSRNLQLLENIKMLQGTADRQICDVPLHAQMVADTTHQLFKDIPEHSSYSDVLNELKLHRLYEHFIISKRECYYEQRRVHEKTPVVIGTTEGETDHFLETHIKCALLAIFSPEECEALNIADIHELVTPILNEISMEKTGLIHGITDGNPKFVHSTFAEYLASKWFHKKYYDEILFTRNASHETHLTITKRLYGIIRRVREALCSLKIEDSFERGSFEMLFEGKCGLVRFFFDQMLSEGCELHEAVLTGSTEFVSEVLESGVPVDGLDRGGRLALHLAASHGHSEIAKLLLAAGSLVSLPCNVLGWSPLRYADRVEAWGVSEQLLHSGSSTSDLPVLRSKVNEQAADDIFTRVVKEGKLEIVELLLKMGADVNVADSSGWTALTWAAINGHTRLVKLLLGQHDDIDRTNELGATPMMYAALNGHRGIVQMLLDRGADMHIADSDGDTALIWASGNGRAEVVQLLIEHKADVNSANKLGITPLMYASLNGHLETIDMLLASGADVRISSNAGGTALIYVTRRDHPDVVQLLLEHNAEINGTNKLGITPLMNAAAYGHLETVQVLLAFGADVKVVDYQGDNALIHASFSGHTEVVQLLLVHKADVNCTNKQGLTPLMRAADNDHLETTQLLLASGADVHVENNAGDTALICATRRGHAEVVQLLLEHNAGINSTNKLGCTSLMNAADSGHLETVQVLLTTGADVHVADSNGDTALIRASGNGHTEVIQFLLEHSADINYINKLGSTPLLSAADNGHLEAVHMLLAMGANVNFAKSNGNTVLTCAALKGHTEVVKLLLEYKADINCTNKFGSTPLMSTAYNGHLETVQTLLAKGADLHVADGEGDIALTYAALRGHTEVVKLLLEHKTEINSSNKLGSTPLMSAAESGHMETVQVLLARGADVHIADSDGNTVLIRASGNGHTEVVQHLLEHKADINNTNKQGFTPLMRAALNGHLELVQVLLTAGADVNVANNDGDTALMCATNNGHPEVIELLLEHNADINCSGLLGLTPLMCAAYKGYLEVVHVLLAWGANVHVTDSTGSTALMWAADSGHSEVVQALLEHKADINITDANGSTPLKCAAYKGYLETVKVLLAKGADLHVADSDGNTALIRAAMEGHTEVVQLLLEHNADIDCTNKQGKTPVMCAVDNGHLKTERVLLARINGIYVDDGGGGSPMNCTTMRGDEEVIQLLLDNGADINVAEPVGDTSVETEIQGDHSESKAILLPKEAALGSDVSVSTC